MRRATVEKRIAKPIFAEFDLDWGFARLRTVYYELDDEWFALATYHSPGQANSAPDTVPVKLQLVAGPILERKTPELVTRIAGWKERKR